MPRTFWTPARDEALRTYHPVLGPTPTASLLGTSSRSVVNRSHRLGLKAPYPKDRAKPSFPPTPGPLVNASWPTLSWTSSALPYNLRSCSPEFWAPTRGTQVRAGNSKLVIGISP